MEKQNILVRQLSKIFNITEKEIEFIKSIEDFKKLDNALDEILFAKSLDDVLNVLY